MTSKHLFFSSCVSVLLFISGCTGVAGDVQADRNALQTGRASDAIGYLTRAAEADPGGVAAAHALGRAYARKSWYADAVREAAEMTLTRH